MEKDCKIFYAWIEKEDVPYVKFVIDTYEGLANTTMMDREKGIMLFRVPPGQEAFFLDLMRSLREDEGVKIKEVWE